MKDLRFRPLRLNKKTGKIVVASYQQWCRLRCADRENLRLHIKFDYKLMNEDDLVYNHKGENLFWFDLDISQIKIFKYNRFDSIDYGEISRLNKDYAFDWNEGNGLHYHCRGLDCNGTPILNHYTSKYIATNYEDIEQFIPLTVGMVKHIFGWFLYELQNTSLAN